MNLRKKKKPKKKKNEDSGDLFDYRQLED